MYKYKAKVLEVYDWDTITAEIDLWFHVKIVEKIRLARIDAPEVRWDSKEQWIESRDFLRDIILDKEIILTTEKRGKYGRYIWEIEIDWENVNDMIVTWWHAIYKQY